mmetsp:Transcript_15235/g.23060  ORF Transcript_15235/g.23060 Transcript_15235/m.23060 type:complete len:80 (-) Transcript_15235:153-392(-)
MSHINNGIVTLPFQEIKASFYLTKQAILKALLNLNKVGSVRSVTLKMGKSTFDDTLVALIVRWQMMTKRKVSLGHSFAL